jgi:hypothetical protein
LSQVAGFRELARHSLGLGISSGSAHRHAEGEESEFSVKIERDAGSNDGRLRFDPFKAGNRAPPYMET